VLQIRHPKDFWAGILFIAFGLTAFGIALNYPLGTAGRMGPGYFPRSLGLILASLGAILVIRGLKLSGEPIVWGSARPLLVVLGSVVMFGLVVAKLGLVFSTILLVVTSSFASTELRWKEAVISSFFLAAFVVAAFVYGLKLQLPALPAFLS